MATSTVTIRGRRAITMGQCLAKRFNGRVSDIDHGIKSRLVKFEFERLATKSKNKNLYSL